MRARLFVALALLLLVRPCALWLGLVRAARRLTLRRLSLRRQSLRASHAIRLTRRADKVARLALLALLARLTLRTRRMRAVWLSGLPLLTRSTEPRAILLPGLPLLTRSTEPRAILLSGLPLLTRSTEPRAILLPGLPLLTRSTEPRAILLPGLPLLTLRPERSARRRIRAPGTHDTACIERGRPRSRCNCRMAAVAARVECGVSSGFLKVLPLHGSGPDIAVPPPKLAPETWVVQPCRRDRR